MYTTPRPSPLDKRVDDVLLRISDLVNPAGQVSPFAERAHSKRLGQSMLDQSVDPVDPPIPSPSSGEGHDGSAVPTPPLCGETAHDGGSGGGGGSHRPAQWATRGFMCCASSAAAAHDPPTGDDDDDSSGDGSGGGTPVPLPPVDPASGAAPGPEETVDSGEEEEEEEEEEDTAVAAVTGEGAAASELVLAPSAQPTVDALDYTVANAPARRAGCCASQPPLPETLPGSGDEAVGQEGEGEGKPEEAESILVPSPEVQDGGEDEQQDEDGQEDDGETTESSEPEDPSYAAREIQFAEAVKRTRAQSMGKNLFMSSSFYVEDDESEPEDPSFAEVTKFLNLVPILQHLKEAERASIVDMLERKEYWKDEEIMVQGEPGDSIYFLEQGTGE
jgi:hypothetical protein